MTEGLEGHPGPPGTASLPQSLQIPLPSQSLLFKRVFFLLMLQKANETLSEPPEHQEVFIHSLLTSGRRRGDREDVVLAGGGGGTAHTPFLLVDEQLHEGTSWIRVS